MKHPKKAPGGWKLAYVVYPGSPGEIAVGVLERTVSLPSGRSKITAPSKRRKEMKKQMLGVRWCPSTSKVETWQEGAEDWFVLPFTFAVAITRSLLQMKASGFRGFDEEGFQKLIAWMTDWDQQAIDDCICY